MPTTSLSDNRIREIHGRTKPQSATPDLSRKPWAQNANPLKASGPGSDRLSGVLDLRVHRMSDPYFLGQSQYATDGTLQHRASPPAQALPATRPPYFVMNHPLLFEPSAYELSELMNRRRFASLPTINIRPWRNSSSVDNLDRTQLQDSLTSEQAMIQSSSSVTRLLGAQLTGTPCPFQFYNRMIADGGALLVEDSLRDSHWTIAHNSQTHQKCGDNNVIDDCSEHELSLMIEEAAEIWRRHAEYALINAVTQRRQQVHEEDVTALWFKEAHQTTFSAFSDDEEGVGEADTQSSCVIAPVSDAANGDEQMGQVCYDCEVGVARKQPVYKIDGLKEGMNCSVRVTTITSPAKRLMSSTEQSSNEVYHISRSELDQPSRLSVSSQTTASSSLFSSVTIDSKYSLNKTDDSTGISHPIQHPEVQEVQSCSSSARVFPLSPSSSRRSSDKEVVRLTAISPPKPSEEFDVLSLQQFRMMRQAMAGQRSAVLVPRRIQWTPSFHCFSSSSTLAMASTTTTPTENEGYLSTTVSVGQPTTDSTPAHRTSYRNARARAWLEKRAEAQSG